MVEAAVFLHEAAAGDADSPLGPHQAQTAFPAFPRRSCVSGFRTSTYSADVSRRTRLFAALKPTFSPSAISRTSGNSLWTRSGAVPGRVVYDGDSEPAAGVNTHAGTGDIGAPVGPQRYETIMTSSTALHGSGAVFGSGRAACRTRAEDLRALAVAPDAHSAAAEDQGGGRCQRDSERIGPDPRSNADPTALGAFLQPEMPEPTRVS